MIQIYLNTQNISFGSGLFLVLYIPNCKHIWICNSFGLNIVIFFVRIRFGFLGSDFKPSLRLSHDFICIKP